MENIITGSQICKSFGAGGEKRKVLDGVSLDIKRGEFVSVMGPSGSGKSTLLFALSGMDDIDSGKIHFNARELSSLKENQRADHLRKEVGFVFQQPTLLRNLNIIDNIILPSMGKQKKNLGEITEKARELMNKVNILELENRDITQASGGQLQRAGICRALMKDPKIIFGDEPTGALDSKCAQEIMDIFSEINGGGTTVLLVTHDAKVAAQTERILFMQDGKFVDELTLPPRDDGEREERIKTVRTKMQALGM